LRSCFPPPAGPHELPQPLPAAASPHRPDFFVAAGPQPFAPPDPQPADLLGFGQHPPGPSACTSTVTVSPQADPTFVTNTQLPSASFCGGTTDPNVAGAEHPSTSREKTNILFIT
jgi:hypothetical protein